MKRKWLVWAVCVLLLAGCSLARPEAEGNSGDKFVGVYVVGDDGSGQGFYNNPNLTEYGSDTVEVEGLGNFSVPREILVADADNNYVFPGLEGGYPLFSVTTRDAEGSVCFKAVSNMAPDEGYKMESINTEQANVEMSGIIYCGPGQDSAIWTAYRVYQTEDGAVYLDGSGNSYSGGGQMGFSSEESYTTTANGESVTESVKVSVKFREVPRLERLVVTQFDGENQALGAQDLALREDLPAVRWQEGAAWALVEEISGEGTKRTVYSLPGEGEDPVSHQVVLLDDEGMGKLAYLNIE